MRFKLERYVARDFLILALVTFVSLLGFFSIFQLADFARIVSERHREFGLALTLTVIELPRLAAEVGPLSVVLSLFIHGTSMCRRGELVAIFSAGVPPWRIFLPILALTALMGVGLFFSTDRLMPAAKRKNESIILGELGYWNSTEWFFKRPRLWFRSGNKLIRLTEIDVSNQTYYGMLVIDVAGGHVRQKIHAEKVFAGGGEFLASNVTVETYGGKDGRELKLEQLAETSLVLPPQFNAFVDLSSRPQSMGLDELERVYKLRRRQGYNPSLYEVEFYARLLQPVQLVALVLLALSFCFRPEVKRSLVRAAAECVGLILLGFVLSQLFRALALGQIVSPQLGGMGPALVLGMAGLYRVLRA